MALQNSAYDCPDNRNLEIELPSPVVTNSPRRGGGRLFLWRFLWIFRYCGCTSILWCLLGEGISGGPVLRVQSEFDWDVWNLFILEFS